MKKKELGRKLVKNAGINSEIVDKLLKYCPKNIKNQIISQRIIEKYREKNEED
jgi:hypothetical protein